MARLKGVPDYSYLIWAALVVSAMAVGISKTALPGLNSIAIAIFATVMPAKASTGALLVLLMVGDIFAVWVYRGQANWPILRRLAPPVLVGIVLGAVFMHFATDNVMRKVIGVVLIVVIVGGLLQRRSRQRQADKAAENQTKTDDPGAIESPPPEGLGSIGKPASHRVDAALYGTLGGFTTMVANAAGPVMSMYFLLARLPMTAFLGTSAFFYLMVNLTKLPFSLGLGIITADMLPMLAVLVPGVAVGAFLGRRIVKRINQKLFENLVIGFTIIGALNLLWG